MAKSIEDFIDETGRKTGLDRTVIVNAVGVIANFVAHEAPPATTQALFGKLPGVQALADARPAPSGGLLGVFNDLIATGISTTDIPAVAGGFVDYAKANDAQREIKDVIAAIPGLAQFV